MLAAPALFSAPGSTAVRHVYFEDTAQIRELRRFALQRLRRNASLAGRA